MRIVQVKGSQYIETCWSLFEMHREELTTNKDIMVLNPDIEKYKKLDEMGVLVSLMVYEDDKIIGYSINFLSRNLHYNDLMMMQNDILFIHPDYRKGSMGSRLIQATEDIAKEKGANFVLFHAKPNTPFEQLLGKRDYSVQDIMFSKVV